MECSECLAFDGCSATSSSGSFTRHQAPLGRPRWFQRRRCWPLLASVACIASRWFEAPSLYPNAFVGVANAAAGLLRANMPRNKRRPVCRQASDDDGGDDFELEEMRLDPREIKALERGRALDQSLLDDPEDTEGWRGRVQGGFKARKQRAGEAGQGRSRRWSEDDDMDGAYGGSGGQWKEPYKGFFDRRDLPRLDVSQFDPAGEMRSLSIEELEARVESKLGSRTMIKGKDPRRKKPRMASNRVSAPPPKGPPPSGAAAPVANTAGPQSPADESEVSSPGRSRKEHRQRGALGMQGEQDEFELPRSRQSRAQPRPETSQAMGSWGNYAPPKRSDISWTGHLGAEDADDDFVDELPQLVPPPPEDARPPGGREWQPPEPRIPKPAPLEEEEEPKFQRKKKVSSWLMPNSEPPPPPKKAKEKKKENMEEFDWSNLDEARDEAGESKYAKMYRATMRRLGPLPWHEVETAMSWTDPMNTTWQELGVSGSEATETLVKNLEDFNLGRPNRFQTQALPKIMNGRDALVTSMTGTGKTLAFLLPLLTNYVLALEGKHVGRKVDRRMPVHRIQKVYSRPRVLIATPSRELAMQTHRVVKDLLEPFPELNATVLIGGGNYKVQDEHLKNRLPLVVVGTPGRIMDHATEGRLLFTDLKAVVYDEIDRLLNVSRSDHIELITQAINKVPQAQRLLVSATASVNEGSVKFADEFLRKPFDHVGPKSQLDLPPRVLHLVNPAPDVEKKILFLKRLSNSRPFPNGVLVFCNNFERARKVTEQLNYMNIPAAVLSGNRTKENRAESIRLMQTGKIDFLVATDIATHGLDFREITHVVNFELPGDSITYTHRAGRCGRQGQNGIVITLTAGGLKNNRLRRYAEEVNVKLFECNVDHGDLGVAMAQPSQRVGIVKRKESKRAPVGV